MNNVFKIELKGIQPSQLYINSEKLACVIEKGSYEPLPIKELNGRVIFTDGHTRAFASYLGGKTVIDVYWDDDDLDWQAYQICVDWCLQPGIYTIADLVGRVVTQDEYEIRWLRRCNEMHTRLAQTRLDLES